MARHQATRKAPVLAVEPEVSTTLARRVFSDLVSRAEYAGRRTAITRRGKRIAGVVSAEDLAFLEKHSPAA